MQDACETWINKINPSSPLWWRKRREAPVRSHSLVKVNPSNSVLLIERDSSLISHRYPFLFFTLGASFCCTRIKLLVPHFPIGKGDVPKIQKARACESPGFSSLHLLLSYSKGKMFFVNNSFFIPTSSYSTKKPYLCCKIHNQHV